MRLIKRIKFAAILLFSLAISQACVSKKEPFDEVVDQLLSQTIPTITPRQLQEMEVEIIDSRSRAEYQVSHLEGARFVDYENFTPDALPRLDTAKPVVVYCTMGYRSEKIGEQLQALGYTQVYNLYGGIIQWKNEGYGVVNNHGEATDHVHGYSRAWGHWLENGVAVYE